MNSENGAISQAMVFWTTNEKQHVKYRTEGEIKNWEHYCLLFVLQPLVWDLLPESAEE